MSDDRPTQPPAAETPPSIYTPLDGSAPPAPQPPAPTFAPATGAAPAVYVLASWPARAVAYIIDAVLINALPLAITVPLGIALGLTAEQSVALFTFRFEDLKGVDTNPLLYGLLGLQAVLQLFALSLFVWRMNGQTPGKKIMKIKIVMADGSHLGLGVALRRELITKAILVPVLAIFTLGVVALLNFLWPIWDKEKRAGHDAFAKTRVVVAD